MEEVVEDTLSDEEYETSETDASDEFANETENDEEYETVQEENITETETEYEENPEQLNNVTEEDPDEQEVEYEIILPDISDQDNLEEDPVYRDGYIEDEETDGESEDTKIFSE